MLHCHAVLSHNGLRKLMKTCFFTIFITVLTGALVVAAAERPNVIIILVDDFGRELIGCLGGESYPTPNIDRMAAEGMTFDICYATPMCSPTRNMLLSGKYNFRNYTDWGQYRFGVEPTIANVLSGAGYNTAVTGKWHLGGWEEKPFGPTRAGFNRYATFNYPEQLAEDDQNIGNFFWNTHLWIEGERERLGSRYSPSVFRDFSISFIKENADKKTPFFLYYPMILAHRPFMPTDLSEKTGVNFRGRRGDKVNFPEMVNYVDNTLGAIRETLKQTGQAENTLLFFTADNGTDNVGEAKELRSRWRGKMLKGGKYVPTERGANVPLFAVWPGTIKAGSQYTKPVDLTDLFPTACSVAGAGKPDGLDGYDLSKVLTGAGDSGRKVAYTWGVFQYSSKKYKTPKTYRGDLLHIVRDERWKYQSDNTLYDLKDGWPQGEPLPPGTHKEVRARLRAELRAIRQSEPKLW